MYIATNMFYFFIHQTEVLVRLFQSMSSSVSHEDELDVNNLSSLSLLLLASSLDIILILSNNELDRVMKNTSE